MKIWLLTQNEIGGYDTYDSCVVRAETEEEAKQVLPGHCEFGARWPSWATSPDKVTAEELGEVTEDADADPGMVLASFNAG